ncbi:MAG: hypothetical protein JSV33_12065 [bacterium]|nr:MAG: hypothetical protein JSV33_12065 [bacterium]
MLFMSRSSKLVVCIALVLFLLSGCGEKSKETAEDADTDEAFRIPDSLLAPLEGYELVRDDYHPVRGGVMANREIELQYPASGIARYVAVTTFGFAIEGYRKVVKEIGKPAEGAMVLIGTKDLDEYKFLARKEWWYYGSVVGDSIYFEPLDIMMKRGIASIGITQRIAQMALHRRSDGRIPRWLQESFASYVAGEREILDMQVEQFRFQNADVDPSPAVIEEMLEKTEDFQGSRIAFYAAYRMLENTINRYSIESVYTFIDELGSGGTVDSASREAFGMDYESFLDTIRVDRAGTAAPDEAPRS